MCSKHGTNWTEADRACTNFLNKEVREPEEILFKIHAELEITENLNDINVQQGNLCLEGLPKENNDSVEVKSSTPGVTSLTEIIISNKVFES